MLEFRIPVLCTHSAGHVFGSDQCLGVRSSRADVVSRPRVAYPADVLRAELHGKLSRKTQDAEDVLTSNVFSFLMYEDRSRFLKRYLDALGISVTTDDAEAAEFTFWPKYDDGTEPDVVIVAGGWYLLIEAKYGTTFGTHATDESQHQLRREITQGQAAAKAMGCGQFRMVTVTTETVRDPSRYPGLRPDEHQLWIWSNWHLVAALLLDTPEEALGRHGRDLLAVLERRNLRPYRGFQRLGPCLLAESRVLFCDRALLRHAQLFAGFDWLAAVPAVDPAPGPVFFHGARR